MWEIEKAEGKFKREEEEVKMKKTKKGRKSGERQ